ncbi:MAG: methyltransferase domain-containing protein [Candidatus Omnitrophica bacterium]|nr:methyltransferase domain-containing protein [Candidatus Omnitrophota bacterium]
MRITYRWKDNNEYWFKRWDDIPVDQPMDNPDVYPLKYAKMTVGSPGQRILEAGCGAGRVLRYFADKGYDITGIDFIEGVIRKLKEHDPKLKAEVGDITGLRYPDGYFGYVLAFGLYHNLENGLDVAIRETFRIVSPGGKVCASFRADNVETWLTDRLYERSARKKGVKAAPDKFHKRNLKRAEFVELFTKAGFWVEEVYPVENMPLFYKFRFFRDKAHKEFNENLGRKEGYKLSPFASLIQRSLIRLFPEQFCNIYVLIAHKPGME